MAAGKKITNRPAASAKSSPANVVRDERDLGGALRAVYKNAVDEDIPAEMLDLLNKLR